MLLNETTPVELGVYAGSTIQRLVITSSGSARMTGLFIDGRATPNSKWVSILDNNVDALNLNGVLGFYVSDESSDVTALKPGVTGEVYIDCSRFVSIRVRATGLPGANATCSATLPSGGVPDIRPELISPGGAGIIGIQQLSGLISTDVQGALQELSLEIAAIPAYTLPTASATVLGGIKIGSGLSIAAGVVSVEGVYSLPIASPTVLGGVKVGTGLSIDAEGVLSAAAGGGSVTSVNSVAPTGGNVALTTANLPEGSNLYYTDARTRGAILTGLSVATSTAVTATDSVLAAVGKLQAQVTLRAPLASPTFTGTVSGITKAMVGLANVDNTTDALKPVSTAQAAADALKANIASPALTGVPTAPTAAPGTNTTQLATTAFVAAAGAGTAPGLVLLATMVMNSGSIITLNTVFTAAYDDYLIIGSGLRHNSGANSDTLSVRFSYAGNLDSGAVYGSANIPGGTAGGGQSQIGISALGLGDGVGVVFQMLVSNISSGFPTVAKCDSFTGMSTGSLTDSGVRSTYIVYGRGAPCTGFGLQWAGGASFYGGTVRVYGFKR